MKYLYIVGEFRKEQNDWIFQGIYSTEEKAVEKCVSCYFFVARVELDYDEPPEERPFDYCYYPWLQKKPYDNRASGK